MSANIVHQICSKISHAGASRVHPYVHRTFILKSLLKERVDITDKYPPMQTQRSLLTDLVNLLDELPFVPYKAYCDTLLNELEDQFVTHTRIKVPVLVYQVVSSIHYLVLYNQRPESFIHETHANTSGSICLSMQDDDYMVDDREEALETERVLSGSYPMY